MKKFLLTYGIMLLVVASLSAQIHPVKVAGNLQKMMYEANLCSNVGLDTMMQKGLFGIGIIDSLQGHVTVMNGRALVSKIKDTYVKTDTTFNHKATMFVYAYVKDWHSVEHYGDVNSYEELEKIVVKTANENGIDTSKPFPFIVRGFAKNLSYHVINWQEGIEHTVTNHKQFAHEIWLSGDEAMFLGFYSSNHKGIFTSDTSNMYIHAVTAKPLTTGQLDTFETTGKLLIYLPGAVLASN
jgi:acetolactate decarboxylase